MKTKGNTGYRLHGLDVPTIREIYESVYNSPDYRDFYPGFPWFSEETDEG